jgi:hypothetical protein
MEFNLGEWCALLKCSNNVYHKGVELVDTVVEFLNFAYPNRIAYCPRKMSGNEKNVFAIFNMIFKICYMTRIHFLRYAKKRKKVYLMFHNLHSNH